jgi:hypothetical protein
MPRTLKSFDVFDTLLARRCIEPRGVLDRLEQETGLPGLADARVQADRELGRRGQPYQLADLWQETRCLMNLDDALATKLHDREVQLEIDESIPIAENLALVSAGDLLISDSYLPPDLIMNMLRQAGLQYPVGLFVSNDGKFCGRVWSELVSQISIREHLGDNLHSDGKMPTAVGIKSVIYNGAAPNAIEQWLIKQDCLSLAKLVREVRLANPYSPSQLEEWRLWLLTWSLKFPLLYLTSLQLEQTARQLNTGEILFVSRDCHLWQRLHQRLFPQRPSRYLFASRRCLLKPSTGYLNYFQAVWQPKSLIVDLFSTGTSWSHFAERLQTRLPMFFIGLVDDYNYLPEPRQIEEHLTIVSLFRNSQLNFRVGKNVEMLNYAPHGSVEDVIWLPSGTALPQFASELEYELKFPQAAQLAFEACLQTMSHYPDMLTSSSGKIVALIQSLIEVICADQELATIYDKTETADENYLRQLLEEQSQK